MSWEPANAHRGAAWVASCVAALERGYDAMVHADPRGAGGGVTMMLTPPFASDDCDAAAPGHVWLTAATSSKAKYEISLDSNADVRESQPWRRDAIGWERREPGREASIAIDASLAPAGGALRDAVDSCLAVMPAAPARSTPPPATLGDADQAAWHLERSCVVESEYVGFRGTPGATKLLLARITARGAGATPILVRLASSRNPAARAVAAMGLGEIQSDEGRATLWRLRTDDALAETLEGCVAGWRPVAAFAAASLAR